MIRAFSFFRSLWRLPAFFAAQDGPPPPMRPNRPPMERAFHAGPPGRWWTDPALVQKLGLTADQQKRIDALFQQNRLKLIDLSAGVQKEEAILEPLLEADQSGRIASAGANRSDRAGARRAGKGQRPHAAGFPRRAVAGPVEETAGRRTSPATADTRKRGKIFLQKLSYVIACQTLTFGT